MQHTQAHSQVISEHPFTLPKSRARVYSKGMGKAVADRTINRKKIKKLKHPEIYQAELKILKETSLNEEVFEYCKKNGFYDYTYEVLKHTGEQILISLVVKAKSIVEDWEDVAERVALGNSLLNVEDQEIEFQKLNHHLRQASVLMSGRHLQHGDETQPTRNMEVFTNCATSASSFLLFYLLLNGSGVGRCLDDEMILVDYKNLPTVVPVIDQMHPDVLSGEISERLDLRSAKHMYKSKTLVVIEVPDSREGWAKAIEKMEYMAFKRVHRNDVLILDFSRVRGRGSPIGGMQNRPASGPGPLILAIEKIAKL